MRNLVKKYSLRPLFMAHQKTALELAQAGKWDEAHEMVQPHEDKLSCLIHALLHRQEGDDANAGYWYRRANEDFPSNNIEQEWDRLYRLATKDP